MASRPSAPSSINDYIVASPTDVRPILSRIRQTISSVAPDARELISYRMPAFKLHGIVVYFAAFKNHIGVCPPISGDETLEKALAHFRGPKGNLKSPLDEPIPYALIRKAVLLRVKQDLARAASREVERSLN